ncbi:hypothetical protein, partial [Salmonella enterica]|uniref:hypothetical protein n=1 Tax=Salmonella enterica TaxID=28901 RepID=UPI003D29A971
RLCTYYDGRGQCTEQTSLGVSIGTDPKDYMKRGFVSFSDPFHLKDTDSHPIPQTLWARN